MKINNAELAQNDSQVVTMILHCIGDFERISDHAVNIMETAKEVSKKKRASQIRQGRSWMYMRQHCVKL